MIYLRNAFLGSDRLPHISYHFANGETGGQLNSWTGAKRWAERLLEPAARPFSHGSCYAQIVSTAGSGRRLRLAHSHRVAHARDDPLAPSGIALERAQALEPDVVVAAAARVDGMASG